MPQTAVVCIAPSAWSDFVIRPIRVLLCVCVCGLGGRNPRPPSSPPSTAPAPCQFPTLYPPPIISAKSSLKHPHGRTASAGNNGAAAEAMFKTADIQKWHFVTWLRRNWGHMACTLTWNQSETVFIAVFRRVNAAWTHRNLLPRAATLPAHLFTSKPEPTKLHEWGSFRALGIFLKP